MPGVDDALARLRLVLQDALAALDATRRVVAVDDLLAGLAELGLDPLTLGVAPEVAPAHLAEEVRLVLHGLLATLAPRLVLGVDLGLGLVTDGGLVLGQLRLVLRALDVVRLLGALDDDAGHVLAALALAGCGLAVRQGDSVNLGAHLVPPLFQPTKTILWDDIG